MSRQPIPPVHVLHVVPTLKAGGMEMALARVVSALPAPQMSHSIVVLKGDAIIADHFGPAVRIHCLHAEEGGKSVPLQLRALLRGERPAVVHARNLGAWPEVALARASVVPRPALVFSFHGLADPRPLPWRWRVASRVLSQTTTLVFTVSAGSKRLLVDHVGLRPESISVIPNGVDTARFFLRPPRPPAAPLRIGTLGSLTPVKNQALLIRVCQRLLSQGLDVTLEICGEGPERPALQAQISSLGLADRVILRGHVADTPAFLHTLDVFVLPSLSEAHPNALSEAMACGLPCAASAVGGIPDILDQGRAGLLFDPTQEGSLEQALSTMLRDPALRAGLGAAAAQRTRDCYSMDAMIERYRELYVGLARKASGPKP